MTNNEQSILPKNSSNIEIALSNANSAISEIPVEIEALWNPDVCPETMLPWLAWALSVDIWDSEWAELQKRAVIKNSISVHKKKGTIGALRTALDGLGYDLTVTEWFQKTPAGDPYTFSIGLNVEQTGIPTGAAFDKVVEVAQSVKNLRSYLDGVEIRAKSNGGIYYAARCFMGEVVNLSAEANA